MSGKLLQAVWDYQGKDLDCTETHILARMAWYASDAGGDIFPSISTLAKQLKLSRSQLFERLKGIKEKGFLIAESSIIGKTVKYRINVERFDLKQEFNDMSSRLPVDNSLSSKSTRPETGQVPVRKPDTPRPETGHNRHHKDNIEKHDRNVFQKKPRASKQAPSMLERIQALDGNQRYVLEKILEFKGIFQSVAITIVEQNPIGEIENVLELAKQEGVKSPGSYLVKSLYEKRGQANEQ